MPKRDGTGPNSDGPKTGRGLGNCIDTTTKKDGTKKINFGNGWKKVLFPGHKKNSRK